MLQAILFASGLVFTTKIIKNVWINENYAKSCLFIACLRLQTVSSMDVQLIELLLIAFGIFQMFSLGDCKIVITRKILFGTHINEFVLLVVEHGIKGSDRRDADRAGRQTCIFVGVVRRVGTQLESIDALEGEIVQGIFDSTHLIWLS